MSRDPRVDPKAGDRLRLTLGLCGGMDGFVKARKTRKPGERIPHVGSAKEYIVYLAPAWPGFKFYASLSSFRANAKTAEVLHVAD